ncbi:ASPIC/UnbV domain-containing protein [Kordia zhangzhouensis]|nr:ASPIC/UnbV domain-containing protein [Kordia zhangzhouensis]
MYRHVFCGEAFLGQNTATEFFGLGTLTTINQLQVMWASDTIHRHVC